MIAGAQSCCVFNVCGSAGKRTETRCGAFVCGAFVCGAFVCGAFVCGAFVCGAFVCGAFVCVDNRVTNKTESVLLCSKGFVPT